MIVQEGQNTVDIAIQETGNIEGLVEICRLNGLSVTAELLPGQEVIPSDVKDRPIVNYYQGIGISVNTGGIVDPTSTILMHHTVAHTTEHN